MNTSAIREKLHSLIDTVDDKKAEAIYTLLSGEANVESERMELIQAEREAYLRGEGKSYSWEEVKEMALNKDKRHVL